jgi:hypothetical protein
MRKLILALVAAVSVAGCSRVGLGRADEGSAFVDFRNESAEQASLYAMAESGGDAVRLGTVNSGNTETLRVPEFIAGRRGTVRFFARLLARSETPTSGPVSLGPGDHYQVTLPPGRNSLTILPGS